MTAIGWVDARAADRRRLLGKRAQLMAGASVSDNVIEAAVSIAAGVVAGSVALVGFGLDSLVEVSSGVVSLWQFRHRLPETRERQALRLIALSFVALAAYVTVETLLCTYLSAVLLVGLVLNATLGWGWTDPLAGLVIAGVAARKSPQAWRGESCGCGPAVSAGSETEPACGCEPGCTDFCCSPVGGHTRNDADQ